MFVVVGVKVIKSKSVVTGQEVDTGVISCIVAFVIFIKTAIEVTGSGYTPGSVPCLPAVAFEKTSERITVASVPFGPASAGREAADLIKTAGVPCLCDQPDVA